MERFLSNPFFVWLVVLDILKVETVVFAKSRQMGDDRSITQRFFRGTTLHEIRNKILLIGASPRKGGNSDLLMTLFAASAEAAGAETETVFLRDLSISPCVGCELCRKAGSCTRFDDDMVGIYRSLRESRGLFLVSPVHNYNVTAWMKAFIDRLYCFYDFQEPRPGPWSSKLAGENRKAVVAAVAEQKSKEDMGFTLEAMSMPLEALGYEVVGKLPFLGIFEKARIKNHPEMISTVQDHAEVLANAIRE